MDPTEFLDIDRPMVKANLEIIVFFPDGVGELAPIEEDGIEEQARVRFRDEGITKEPVTVYLEYEEDRPFPPDPLTVKTITFQFDQDVFRFTELEKAVEIVEDIISEYRDKADEMEIFVGAQDVTVVGPDS